jgi:uncharacterized protein (DUF1697 family)
MVLQPWVGLIRGIGPSTHKKMSMAQLRDGCAAAGLDDVRTVLSTGNVLFRSTANEAELKPLVTGVVRHFGLDNDVFVRTAPEAATVLANNPFPHATVERPNHVLVVFMDAEPSQDGVDEIRRLPGSERIAPVGRALFVDYVDGVGRSKVTPDAIDRRLKQPGTARNMNTLRKLVDLSLGS